VTILPQKIKNKSHQETAYKKCEDGDIMSYEYAKDLSLSLIA
ncbi:unnamed protein product, partial [marine sediment metagenome]